MDKACSVGSNSRTHKEITKILGGVFQSKKSKDKITRKGAH